MTRRHRWFAGTALAAAAVLVVAGCSSAHTSAPGAVRSGGNLTFALDEELGGFNSLEIGDNLFALTEVMDQTLPNDPC
jgi:hypothetical protein